jgi:hypothetical protein
MAALKRELHMKRGVINSSAAPATAKCQHQHHIQTSSSTSSVSSSRRRSITKQQQRIATRVSKKTALLLQTFKPSVFSPLCCSPTAPRTLCINSKVFGFHHSGKGTFAQDAGNILGHTQRNVMSSTVRILKGSWFSGAATRQQQPQQQQQFGQPVYVLGEARGTDCITIRWAAHTMCCQQRHTLTSLHSLSMQVAVARAASSSLQPSMCQQAHGIVTTLYSQFS